LTEEVAGNLFAIIFLSFTSSLRICTYSAIAVTAYCSETRVSGLRRLAGSKSRKWGEMVIRLDKDKLRRR